MLQRIHNVLMQPRVMMIVVAIVTLLSVTGIVLADTATTSVTVGNTAPSVDLVDAYGTDLISLTESTSVTLKAKVSITDANGVGTESGGACSGLSSVDAKFYRDTLAGSVGTLCSQDDNNCYVGTCVATTTGDSCTGGSDTSVDYDCSFTVWYIADPTEAGAAFASDNWIIAATTTDTSAASATATNTPDALEVAKLLALDVTAAINYGSVGAGSNTGAVTQSATTTNTGNAPQDNDIGGDNMCDTTYTPACTGGISEDNQKFATSSKTYASLDFTLAASATPASIELDLPKPTATTSSVLDDTHWGINIPGGTLPSSYAGLNEFVAIDD